MFFRSFCTLVAASLGFAACASSERNIPAYDGASSASVRPVEVFVSKRPSRPYVERGVIEVRQRRGDSSDDAFNRMSRTAASRGCDAVILVDSNSTVSGTILDGTGWVKTQKEFRGACVVYTEGASAPTGAPGQLCIPNVTQLCHGPGACQGAQACRADGMGFTTCDCGSSTGSAAANTAPANTNTTAEAADTATSPEPIEQVSPRAPIILQPASTATR